MRSLPIWSIMLMTASLHAQPADSPRTVNDNVILEANAVIHTPLIIAKSGITIDGNGATLQGPGTVGDIASLAKAGIGITAQGVSNVTIRNLKVRGFESALVASDGEGWTIEGCDFSDNYHDPEFGWGDGSRNGGIILTRMHKCVIRNNKANRVWNGLDLWESHDNKIEKNDFSHCSNVCLKMWTACRNLVVENNLSYGLRIRPGEVHARDSTSVLMESGSNDNRYERNDITHGGDGVFIRVLNGWCSTGNVFVENDCSYANNNGFEAWSPGNTYIRNKANHCSYGFWLGGSDNTVLIGNEAGYNGRPDGFHNAPESDFQHGGIVIVHGSGSHTLIEGNYCHHNAGAGIVFRGDLGSKGAKWKMYHLVVQNNRLEHNKWGLFARFTDWLDLAGNTFEGNEQDEFLEDVTNLSRREADPEGKPAPRVVLEGPSKVTVGEMAVFDASKSVDEGGRKLKFRWDVGGREYKKSRVEHVFKEPGFYRVGVTAHNGYLAGLAFRDVYVARPVKEEFTEGHAKKWKAGQGGNEDGGGKVLVTDDSTAIVGKTSLRLCPDPYRGAEVTIVTPPKQDADWNLTGKKQISFWIRFQNSNHGFQGPNPIIRLHGDQGAFTYTPAFNGLPRNLLGDLPYPEARYGWLYVTVPLKGGPEWLRSETLAGAQPPHVDNNLEFVTVTTPIETQDVTAMTSDGTTLYCASADSDSFWRSADGRSWQRLKSPGEDLGPSGPSWINGMLAFYPGVGEKGILISRRHHPQKDEFGHDRHLLVFYDLAAEKWSWTEANTTAGHGVAIAGDHLYGLAHALMGNYGGPLACVNLKRPEGLGERTVFGGVKGPNDGWYSRAGQMAVLDGLIYVTKNDWETPQPKDVEKIGDRLLVFDPREFKPSQFTPGDPWNSTLWKAVETPARDLGPLPFEIGHGSALVALPPGWGDLVGRKGGLFLVAGCSPSNHEGYGAPSAKYAVYDVATGKFTTGSLPDATGTGTAAAFCNGLLYIKRGGMNFGPTNSELWVVRPLPAEEARTAKAKLKRERMTLKKVTGLSMQFDSIGHEPFDIWIDGLAIE